MSLIPSEASLSVMAGLFAISALAFILEKTRLGAQLSGAVIAILGAILASNLGLIPFSSPAYDFVFTYFVPLLLPLFLFQANLKRIVFESTRLTLAFLIASAGTVAGVTIAALSLDLTALGAAADLTDSQREPAIAGLFASTYIGGSVNYAALGEITGLNADSSFFSAATAADNLFSAVYLAFLAVLPGWRLVARFFPPYEPASSLSLPASAHDAPSQENEKTGSVTAASLCMAISTSLIIVAASDALLAWIDASSWRFVMITAVTLTLATMVPGLADRLAGAFELGVCLSFVFFAAIAAGADVPAMLAVAPLLIALVLILLSVHALVLLLFGGIFRLSIPELVIASNAAVLGATTAPALAAAKGWRDLVTPAVLVGVLGYALGTFVGTVIYKSWGAFL
ncbi:MAG: DUF819 family protein [Pseudomonadota bacterium]